MALETKIMLLQLADSAVFTDSRRMYKIITKLLKAEGVEIKSFEEAKAELEIED